jgi:hypothetical protein
VLTVSADEYPEVDIWSCRRRSELFEEVFEAELSVQWAGHAGAMTANSATAATAAPAATIDGAAKPVKAQPALKASGK